MDGGRREDDMGTATVEVTSKNFKEVVEKDGIVLIDWWAPWCGPCRVFGPTYEKVAGKNPDITFAKVNTEDQPELAGSFDIRSIPTLMILRDKVLLFSQFVEMLKILENSCRERGIKTHILTGETKGRQEVVNAFQQDPDPAVFLLSLRAAGTGLNACMRRYRP